MDLDKLVYMKEPDRGFWYRKGLLLSSARSEAMNEDEIDRKMGG